MGSIRVPIAVAAAALSFAAVTSEVRAQEPYYKGKRLTVLINFAAGGPADIEGRIFAKHLVKHIDGQPSLVVQNMDGAGGLVGAQWLGEIAPKDGSVVGALTGTAWITGRAEYVVDDTDPFPEGFTVGDLWGLTD